MAVRGAQSLLGFVLIKYMNQVIKESLIITRLRNEGNNGKRLLLLFKVIIGARFIKFCIVGGTGALLQSGLTFFFTEVTGLYYMLSLAIAIVMVTVFNFTCHSGWTFKDRK